MNLIKNLTLVLFIIWILYWRIEDFKSHKEKKRTRKFSHQILIEKFLVYFTGIILITQLLGISILPIEWFNLALEMTGLIIFIAGFLVSVLARISLSSNWSAGYEYQIKKDHELIIKGIYEYIRHPIYLAIILMLVGIELVVGSHLWIAALMITSYVMINWANREEKLLTNHFGQKYKNYMKKTKKLIPFIY